MYETSSSKMFCEACQMQNIWLYFQLMSIVNKILQKKPSMKEWLCSDWPRQDPRKN